MDKDYPNSKRPLTLEMLKSKIDKIKLSDSDPQDVGTASPGISKEFSRSDHSHGGGSSWAGTPSQPTRALNTVYQNTTTKVRVVAINAVCYWNDVSGTIEVYIGLSSEPDMFIGGIPQDVAHPAADTVTFVVPAGYYYECQSTYPTGPVDLISWTEWDG